MTLPASNSMEPRKLLLCFMPSVACYILLYIIKLYLDQEVVDVAPSKADLIPVGLVSHRIINPHDYTLLINEPKTCFNDDGSIIPVFLLVLVLSTNKNQEERKLVRETWGSVKLVDGRRVVTLFLLGKSVDSQQDQELKAESRAHGDLLQEDFVDAYRNLTLKTIMGLKWAATFCFHAQYVMKADDNVFVGLERLVRHLGEPTTPTNNFMTGYVFQNGLALRWKITKWSVSRSEYPFSRFPPYCSGGGGYVLSGDLPQMIYERSLHTKYLFLEDAFVGLCLLQINVLPVDHPLFNKRHVPFSVCKYREIFTSHMSSSVQRKYSQFRRLSSGDDAKNCGMSWWIGLWY